MPNPQPIAPQHDARRGPVAAEPVACAGAASELFFPLNRRPPVDAFELCARCPILETCATYALVTFNSSNDDGVWGMTTPADRRAIRSGDAQLERIHATNRRRVAERDRLRKAATQPVSAPVTRTPSGEPRPDLAQTLRLATAYAHALGTDLAELRSAARNVALVELRHTVAYLLCERHAVSSPTAGLALNRDHSSILHAVSRVRERLEAVGAPLAEHLDELVETASR